VLQRKLQMISVNCRSVPVRLKLDLVAHGICALNPGHEKQVAHYRRETALQGGLVMAKSGRLGLGGNVCGHNRSIFNHDVIGQQSNGIR